MIKQSIILLVEDNPADVFLVKEALKEFGRNIRINVVEDGEAALVYLKKVSESEKELQPQFILLDLNLPKKNGIEVLKEIKSSESLRKIPVIILTSSKELKDIIRSYDLHANCFVSKPQELDEFIFTINEIAKFWLDIAKLPLTS